MPSTIEWTDETWNPVTGCTRVSPGCDHCYMFALYPRLTAMGVPGYERSPDEVQLLPERIRAPLGWARPRRVFVNSMSDVFHPSVPYDFVNDIFDVMREASEQRGHVFQVLTKRPGRAVGWWQKQPGALWRRMAGRRVGRNVRGEPEVCAAYLGSSAAAGGSPVRLGGAAPRSGRPPAVA